MNKAAFLALMMSISGLAVRADDWPRWRGPELNGHVPASVPVPATLPAAPRILWHIKVGDGLASPVVQGGRVYYLDNQQGRETVHAADAETGRERWQTPLDEVFKDTQTSPGPRNTPLADGDRVYAQSCRGEFHCLNAADGKLLWRVNFVKDFRAVFIGEKGSAVGASRHGYDGSPVIDGDHIIVGVGGTNGASVVCFDKRSGRVVWKSQDDVPGFSGPVLATIGGVKQSVSFTAEGVIGLNAQDGTLLWRVPVNTRLGRNVITPVIVGDRVLVASHTAGLIGIKVAQEGNGFQAARVWTAKESSINFASPVAAGQYLYGVGPSKNLICVDIATGRQVWSKSGLFRSSAGSAYATMLVMDNRILTLLDSGQLLLIDTDPQEYREISATQVCGKNWCNPAYANGRLYLRDAQELRCVEILP